MAKRATSAMLKGLNREQRQAVRHGDGPLLVVAAEGDELCPPASALHALERWGGADRTHRVLDEGWGHLDPIVATEADRVVAEPVVQWLRARRRAACERDPLG